MERSGRREAPKVCESRRRNSQRVRRELGEERNGRVKKGLRTRLQSKRDNSN